MSFYVHLIFVDVIHVCVASLQRDNTSEDIIPVFEKLISNLFRNNEELLFKIIYSSPQHSLLVR